MVETSGNAETMVSFECEGSTAEAWTVQSATLTERLNHTYELLVSLATDEMMTEPVLMLGTSAMLTVTRGTMMKQVMGIVSEVREGTSVRGRVVTTIVVEPALEALGHRVNTRIFQEKSVPEILEEVLNEGLTEYQREVDIRLQRTYPACDYRVQFDESDLSFVQRLMEEEGIVYFFEFDGKSELLVLIDSETSYRTVKSVEEGALKYSEYEGHVGGFEAIGALHVMSQVQPTKYVTRHFDWSHPPVFLEGESQPAEAGDVPNGAALAPDREIYEHDTVPLSREPGGTDYGNDKEDQVKIRREEQSFDARVATGKSSVLGMTIGANFQVTGHPRAELDGEYLVIELIHNFDSGGRSYHNQFRCIPSSVPFRPMRLTLKPRIVSVQTATVVGPSGEEIHTDEHGRIRVQFHWDRLGESDDHSSCWIRVMQPWGGPGWGFVFIPRIGMEVIVTFVNGDPDQPMVIGSVYNGENLPPYTLPDDKTKSTIKTNSSLGGDGFNELRFEDKAAEEEIYIHAQKDFNEEVLHCHNTHVGVDQTNTVDENQTEHVKKEQVLTVDENRTKTVKGDETTTVEGNRTETVKQDETITIEGTRTETVNADERISVKGVRDELVESSEFITIKGDQEITVKGDHIEKVSGDRKNKIKGKRVEKVGSTYNITAKKAFTLKDDAEIKLEAGDSSITLKKDGTIEIKGKTVEIVGGKSKAKLDDTATKLEGPTVDVKGDDGVTLDGASVDLK